MTTNQDTNHFGEEQRLQGRTPNWAVFDEKLQRLSENNHKLKEILWKATASALYIPGLGHKQEDMAETSSLPEYLKQYTTGQELSEHDSQSAGLASELDTSSESSEGLEEAWTALQEGLSRNPGGYQKPPRLSFGSEYSFNESSLQEEMYPLKPDSYTGEEQHHQHAVQQALPIDTDDTDKACSNLEDESRLERLAVLGTMEIRNDAKQADDEEDSAAAAWSAIADELHADMRIILGFMDASDEGEFSVDEDLSAWMSGTETKATWSAEQLKTLLEANCNTVATLLRKGTEPEDELLETTARMCTAAMHGGLLQAMPPVPALISDSSDSSDSTDSSDSSDSDSDVGDSASSSEDEAFIFDSFAQRYSLNMARHNMRTNQDLVDHSSDDLLAENEVEYIKAHDLSSPQPQGKKKRVMFDDEAMQAPEDGPELTWRNSAHRDILRAQEEQRRLNEKVDEVLKTTSTRELGDRIKLYAKLQETIGLDQANAFLKGDKVMTGAALGGKDHDEELWRKRALAFNAAGRQPKTQPDVAVPCHAVEEDSSAPRSFMDLSEDEDETSGPLKKMTALIKRVSRRRAPSEEAPFLQARANTTKTD